MPRMGVAWRMVRVVGYYGRFDGANIERFLTLLYCVVPLRFIYFSCCVPYSARLIRNTWPTTAARAAGFASQDPLKK